MKKHIREYYVTYIKSRIKKCHDIITHEVDFD